MTKEKTKTKMIYYIQHHSVVKVMAKVVSKFQSTSFRVRMINKLKATAMVVVMFLRKISSALKRNRINVCNSLNSNSEVNHNYQYENFILLYSEY